MREGFLKSNFSVYLVFIAVNGLPSLLKYSRAFETVILHSRGIFLKKIDTVYDLESGSGRIEPLSDSVQKCSRLIVFEQIFPILFDVVGIIIRFRDHGEDPPRLDLCHNDRSLVIAHRFITGFLDIGIKRSNKIIAGVKFILRFFLVVISHFFRKRKV